MNHWFLSTERALDCCSDSGCWKSRCQLVKDGNPKDAHNLCQYPVGVRRDLRIPRCMDMGTVTFLDE